MDWSRELKKPVFIGPNGRLVTLQEAKTTIKNFGVINETWKGMPKMATVFASRGLTKIGSVDNEDAKRLVIGRLKAEPGRVFKFLDGRRFTAEQAASEVVKETKEGTYFFGVEKRAIELAEEAFAKGQV